MIFLFNLCDFTAKIRVKPKPQKCDTKLCYLSSVYFSSLVALPRGGQGEFPLCEQLQQKLHRRVQQPLVRVLHLTQQEIGETEQHVVAPVGEIHQQALQGVLGYETQLVIHVDGQSGEKI